LPANSFELKDIGDGRFVLTGEMTFDTAERILRASEIPFEEHTRIEVDLSGVEKADSAGLALLLEWITWANHTVREIRFIDSLGLSQTGIQGFSNIQEVTMPTQGDVRLASAIKTVIGDWDDIDWTTSESFIKKT